ncbi:Exosome complex exonuclease RRP40 [Fasciola hepatica]|uniref:Ribosomal RNA-processing protein 40 n=1 Tax=Fasciola hepatica TaxID=6192 RepID=A0A4E0RIG4_FASHE|nr:Exosome complex exonuclease RRP40 [Fasciola hepatica]
MMDPAPDAKKFKASSKAHRSDTSKMSKQSLWLEFPGQCGVVTSVSALSRHSLRCPVTQFHMGDRVVGVVTRKAGEYYMVDIGCSSSASLGYLSFEGASKKNRPDLNIGDVVYAMVTQADRDLEVELSCVDESGRASGMGILGRHEPGTVGNAGGMAGGVMLHCTPELVRRLGNPEQFPLLNLLAKSFPFEVCLGANGRIWLTARSPRETMLLANVISLADHIPADQCCALSRNLVPG